MSHITDVLDATESGDGEEPRPLFALASSASDATEAGSACLVAGGEALEALQAAMQVVVARGGAGVRTPLRLVGWSRARGPQGSGGSVGALLRGELEVRPVLEGAYRGHELFVADDARARCLLLAAALAGELPPIEAAGEAAAIDGCLAAAEHDLVGNPALAWPLRLASEHLDVLLEQLDMARPEREAERCAGATRSIRSVEAPTSSFGVVIFDSRGGALAATLGEHGPSPLLSLRAGRPWVGLAGDVSARAALLVLARRADRGLAVTSLLDGPFVERAALVLSDDEGRFESPRAAVGSAVVG